MEKLIGHGLRDDAIGVMQVGETVTEILVNGWWIISVEDCMTNDHGHGYYLELLVNHHKMSLNSTGFLTIDDTVDGMFVYGWSHALAVLLLNLDHFKDRTPQPEPETGACGWCGSETYPHICEGSLTALGENLTTLAQLAGEGANLVSTANASAPKPPAVTQEEQDAIELSKAGAHCNCGSNSSDWRHHKRLMAERLECAFYKAGAKIQARKDRVQRWRDRSMSS